jgi:hypothetical protein
MVACGNGTIDCEITAKPQVTPPGITSTNCFHQFSGAVRAGVIDHYKLEAVRQSTEHRHQFMLESWDISFLITSRNNSQAPPAKPVA